MTRNHLVLAVAISSAFLISFSSAFAGSGYSEDLWNTRKDDLFVMAVGGANYGRRIAEHPPGKEAIEDAKYITYNLMHGNDHTAWIKKEDRGTLIAVLFDVDKSWAGDEEERMIAWAAIPERYYDEEFLKYLDGRKTMQSVLMFMGIEKWFGVQLLMKHKTQGPYELYQLNWSNIGLPDTRWAKLIGTIDNNSLQAPTDNRGFHEIKFSDSMWDMERKKIPRTFHSELLWKQHKNDLGLMAIRVCPILAESV